MPARSATRRASSPARQRAAPQPVGQRRPSRMARRSGPRAETSPTWSAGRRRRVRVRLAGREVVMRGRVVRHAVQRAPRITRDRAGAAGRRHVVAQRAQLPADEQLGQRGDVVGVWAGPSGSIHSRTVSAGRGGRSVTDVMDGARAAPVPSAEWATAAPAASPGTAFGAGLSSTHGCRCGSTMVRRLARLRSLDVGISPSSSGLCRYTCITPGGFSEGHRWSEHGPRARHEGCTSARWSGARGSRAESPVDSEHVLHHAWKRGATAQPQSSGRSGRRPSGAEHGAPSGSYCGWTQRTRATRPSRRASRRRRAASRATRPSHATRPSRATRPTDTASRATRR